MSITSINRVDRSDPTTNPTLSTELAASDTVRITLHFQQASSTLPDFAGEVVLDPYDDMGLAYNVYLNADRIFGCKSCKTHLATHDSIISRVSVSKVPCLPKSAPEKHVAPTFTSTRFTKTESHLKSYGYSDCTLL